MQFATISFGCFDLGWYPGFGLPHLRVTDFFSVVCLRVVVWYILWFGIGGFSCCAVTLYMLVV